MINNNVNPANTTSFVVIIGNSWLYGNSEYIIKLIFLKYFLFVSFSINFTAYANIAAINVI